VDCLLAYTFFLWGDEYLLRTDNFSTSPVDFADYLLLVGEIGFPIWENPMNPYERQSHSTLTAFTVLSDSSAVALAVDTNPLTGPSRSLLRFNRSGDITEIEELPTDDSSSLSPYDLCSAEDSTVFFTEIVTDIEGFRGIKIIAFGANLVEEYTATIAREGANTYGNALYAEPDGTLFFIHTTSSYRNAQWLLLIDGTMLPFCLLVKTELHCLKVLMFPILSAAVGGVTLNLDAY